MRYITGSGSGFIKIGGELINLRQFKSIEKYAFGMNESTNGDFYGILVTPMLPSEEDIVNGVTGEYFIATYSQAEESDFEADFNEIETSLELIN